MTGHDTEARDLVRAYAERIRLAVDLAHADQPTGDMARQVLAAGATLDVACEEFRSRHYPRAARVFVGLYTVLVASPAGRRHRTVYDGLAEFAPTAVSS